MEPIFPGNLLIVSYNLQKSKRLGKIHKFLILRG